MPKRILLEVDNVYVLFEYVPVSKNECHLYDELFFMTFVLLLKTICQKLVVHECYC